MPRSPEEYAHSEWIGYVQPVGLVVSVPAMLDAQCYVNKNISGEHKRFLDCLQRDKNDEIIPEITDFPAFAQKCLEWEAEDLKEIPQNVRLPDESLSLEVILPQYHETLRPTHAVPVFKPQDDESPWQMLIQVLPTDADFDEPSESDSSRHWHAAPQLKFERLLRETQVPIGLLCNGRQLRLVYAPRGESSGHATFNVGEMVQVAGRPMFAALHMLLSADRMFTLGENQRLPAILANSRKYQNTVSTKLAEQVLAALYELMRGFQSANDVRKGELLRDVLASDPDQVYSGLLRVLMRLVFVLYAEDRDLMSSDPVYSNNYSITGLFERLREDAGRFPDTMDSRFGAWSQLLTLFRLVYEGGQHGTFKLPPRKGYLFDPNAFPFLEGRGEQWPVVSGQWSDEEKLATDDQPLATIPRISDGVVYRVLRNLLILDGERLSYRTLDVEQIGSVYETVMGFNLEVARGQSIAVKPVKSHGAPATINLDELLETPGEDRAKWIKDQTDQKISGQALKDLKAAESIDDLLEALDKKIDKKVTPRVVPAGAIVLQPSEERRRTGSHYTPRSLTMPIVEKALEPVLQQLVRPPEDEAEGEKTLLVDTKGRKTKAEVLKSERDEEAARQAREKGSPHPRQILDLKVCDPAMGSGAFLVEACRQLGDELVAAWHAHDCVPTAEIPPDEDEVLYARRLVAQRCLYGVDKNPMAVDLSKLSLWLATLAKDHPFTFLDHALRHGDSLVGLTADQITAFTWDPKPGKKKRPGGATFQSSIQSRVEETTDYRRKILDAREDAPYRDQEQQMALADEALSLPRLVGDACISAFLSESKKRAREEKCDELFASLADWLESGMSPDKRKPLADAAQGLRTGEHPVPPFHWEIEFPEVFVRENGGFDVYVGNPPFAGKNTLALGTRVGYVDWLKTAHRKSHGNSDLVAHFFRRCFWMLRRRGSMGFIATNTIAEGDTRTTGLRWICKNGGTIFNARKRVRWPGQAAVIVSVIHVSKGELPGTKQLLDGRQVPTITAFLFHAGSSDDPFRIEANDGLSFQGPVVLGMGFTFDDDNDDATPLSEMKRLVDSAPEIASRIHPYMGGDEMLNHPEHKHHRYVINFADLDESQAREWPSLMSIVEEKVRPERMKLGNNTDARRRKKYWWQWGRYTPALFKAIEGLPRMMMHSFPSKYLAFTFVPTSTVIAAPHCVFALADYASFCVLQSRVHEAWATFFSSTQEDRLRYTISDAFDTFPFAENWQTKSELEACGCEYFSERAALMLATSQGLTDTYNRFHDPDETSLEIKKLRELHDEMDRAVLRAYGWDDLAEQATCEFLLEYEEEENDDPTAKKSKKKKPWRYRWPGEFRDEVLARLLELNEQRAMEEKLAGKTAETKAKSTGSNSRGRKSSKKKGSGLFKK